MRIISLNRTFRDVNDNVETSISAIVSDGNERDAYSLMSDHPQYHVVSDAVTSFENGEMTNEALAEVIKNSVNLITKVAEKMVQVKGVLDGRMAISGNRVTVDGDPIDPVLEAHVLRLLRGDGTPKDHANWSAFARFVDNLYGNVSEYVREQLFGWLNYENLHGQGFTITSDGCFIGYKGCAGDANNPVSVHHGPAVVDGVPMNGAIPNRVGTTVEIARSEVQFDPAVGCAPGLHVGTYGYASNWAQGILVTVKVNPRDVVSVPVESDAQKIRTCRYEVLELVDVPYTEPTWDDGDYDDEDRCENCDELYDYCDCYDDEKFCDGCDELSDYCTCEDDAGDDVAGYDEEEDEDLSPNVVVPSPGDIVRLTYRENDGSVVTYVARVQNVNTFYIHGKIGLGTLTPEDRSFVVSKVATLHVIG